MSVLPIEIVNIIIQYASENTERWILQYSMNDYSITRKINPHCIHFDNIRTSIYLKKTYPLGFQLSFNSMNTFLFYYIRFIKALEKYKDALILTYV
jgi:hypothetical protein